MTLLDYSEWQVGRVNGLLIILIDFIYSKYVFYHTQNNNKRRIFWRVADHFVLGSQSGDFPLWEANSPCHCSHQVLVVFLSKGVTLRDSLLALWNVCWYHQCWDFFFFLMKPFLWDRVPQLTSWYSGFCNLAIPTSGTFSEPQVMHELWCRYTQYKMLSLETTQKQTTKMDSASRGLVFVYVYASIQVTISRKEVGANLRAECMERDGGRRDGGKKG